MTDTITLDKKQLGEVLELVDVYRETSRLFMMSRNAERNGKLDVAQDLYMQANDMYEDYQGQFIRVENIWR